MSRARSKLRTMLSCTHYVALIWGE
jgi:hypothetical protein